MQCGVSISSVVGFLKLHRETGSVDPAKFGGYKEACGKSSISRFLAGYLELPAHVMASPSKRRATKPTRERSIAAGEITSDVRSPIVRERGKAPETDS
jgi:hypothetical protein